MILRTLRTFLSNPRDQPTSSEHPGDVTQLLLCWSDPACREKLFSAVYPELKRVAEFKMRKERADHTLQPTALVGEVFLHLVRSDAISWQNRAHFLAIASEAMRRILVDHARAKNAAKRPSAAGRVALHDDRIQAEGDFVSVLELDDLLKQLARKYQRAARVVELRYFGGLTFTEISEVLGVNERTAKRDWQLARAWLFTGMKSGVDDGT